jgi:polyisoprenoid-binding protein YceI/rhodanese-related sulfurtransferase
MTVAELKTACDAGTPLCIIDTLPPEFCEREHIPGARNACVYEMVFLDRVSQFVSDPQTRIVVYGSSDRSQASAVAMDKLSRAGYANVSELAGGLEAWQAAGFPVEPENVTAVELPVLADGSYSLDLTGSRLEWTGRNINGRHSGTITLAGGEIAVKKGAVTAGTVTIDMDTIVNLDLKDEAYSRMLISHLKSEDFFDVAAHPTALVSLYGSELLEGAAAGSPDRLINGALELKGTSKPLALPAEIVPQEDGTVKIRAACEIDRTQWGVLYGSGRFFEKLGMHLVSDIISIELFLLARKNQEIT